MHRESYGDDIVGGCGKRRGVCRKNGWYILEEDERNEAVAQKLGACALFVMLEGSFGRGMLADPGHCVPNALWLQINLDLPASYFAGPCG